MSDAHLTLYALALVVIFGLMALAVVFGRDIYLELFGMKARSSPSAPDPPTLTPQSAKPTQKATPAKSKKKKVRTNTTKVKKKTKRKS